MELPVPKSIEEPVVVLDGRYCFSPKSTPIEPGTESLTIEAGYGACLEVEVLQEMLGDELVSDGTLRLIGYSAGAPGGYGTRSGPLDQREFRGLNAELVWMVLVETEAHYSPGKLGIPNARGRDRVRSSCAGTRPAGSKEPSWTTMVPPWLESRSNCPMRCHGSTCTGPDRKRKPTRRASLSWVRSDPASAVSRRSRKADSKRAAQRLTCVPGQRVKGVELTLSLGLSIAGQVLTPTGEEAAKANVVIEGAHKQSAGGPWMGGPSQAGRAKTDAEGKFKVTGLKPGKYSIKSTLRQKTKDGKRIVLHARVAGVEAGTSNLSVALEAPLRLRGHVVDDQGAPIEEFRIIARSTVDGGPTERDSYKSPDGAFVFERVGEGTWRIEAEAKGYKQTEPIEVDLPRLEGDLRLTLARRGSVSGRVLSATGVAVPDATVLAVLEDSPWGDWGNWSSPRATTNNAGEFEFDELGPNIWKLTASADGWADSEAQAIELASGGAVEDVVMTLRRGGRIVGTVTGADGRPVSGQRVIYGDNAWGWTSEGETRTNGAGRFEFEGITPGEWVVTATASMEEIGKRMREVSKPEDWSTMMSDMLSASVEVVEGETTEVNLGEAPLAPVRIVGRVLLQGEGVPGAQVYAVVEGQAIMQGMKQTLTDEEGAFSLTVDRPGAFILSTTKGRQGVEAFVDIPEAETVTHDLVIPSGGITGTVTLPNRDPAAGITMTLEREDGLGSVRWSGNSAKTNSEGQYTLESLPPGVYKVAVNTGTWMSAANDAYATEVKGNLRVDGENMLRVDFRLKKPGTIQGIVLDPAGQPIEGVTVFFRDSKGRQVHTVSTAISNVAGQFEQTGLASGSYTLHAKNEFMASAESTPIPVETGKVSQAQLRLVRGTTLRVTLTDEELKQARLRVEVFDENDHEVRPYVDPQGHSRVVPTRCEYQSTTPRPLRSRTIPRAGIGRGWALRRT